MQIYVMKNNQQIGPFDESMVLAMFRNGQLSPNDLGVKQGGTQWSSLREMFPNQPHQSVAPLEMSSAKPVKKGFSKILLFMLLGVGSLFLFSIIGIIAFVNAIKPSQAQIDRELLVAKNTKMQELFDKDKEKYIKPPANKQLTKSPYIQGKILYYRSEESAYSNKKNWEIKNIIPEFSESGTMKGLYAQTSEEVGTIILQECQRVVGGQYEMLSENGSPTGKVINGYNQSCNVTIIDNKIPAVIFTKNFLETLAAGRKVKSTETEVAANVPNTKIEEFIVGLPRK